LALRVIGIGQAMAGDDGVGLAMLRMLREMGPPPGVELHEVGEVTALLPLLETAHPVVLVDALVADSATGRVLELMPERLARAEAVPASTHGIGVLETVELARTLFPETVSPCIRIVGVTIGRPDRYRDELSAEVAAALPAAVAAVLAHVGS
jgi:hydrogenase maturation protease